MPPTEHRWLHCFSSPQLPLELHRASWCEGLGFFGHPFTDVVFCYALYPRPGWFYPLISCYIKSRVIVKIAQNKRPVHVTTGAWLWCTANHAYMHHVWDFLCVCTIVSLYQCLLMWYSKHRIFHRALIWTVYAQFRSSFPMASDINQLMGTDFPG